ncbi:PilZ domain-containing protein [Marinobacter sp.]|uniref:PilZ domain-containing protein n=1 Tax=Marinobacter sp. TaxID=50741 RepID=UPI00384FAA26
MEHRLTQRYQAGKSLLVYKRGLPIATGTLKDVSKRGMFMVTDLAEVGLHQKLEIEFCIPGKKRDMPRRIAAVVVRKTENGVGMEFDLDDEQEADRDEVQALLTANANSLGQAMRDFALF